MFAPSNRCAGFVAAPKKGVPLDIESLRPYMSVSEALPRVANNEKLYLTLLGMFVQTNAQQLQTAQQQLDQGDIAEAAKTLHTLKGVTANLALTDLFEKITVFEGQLKQGIVPEGQMALLNESLEATLTQIRRYAADRNSPIA